jgi:hypothetical protein
LKLTKTQHEILNRMAEGERIAFFPPTQSVWIYMGNAAGRVSVRVGTFNSLTLNGTIKRAETSGQTELYEITDAGRTSLLRN